MKIGNTKINFKFKVGWKESSKKEKIIAILSYLAIAAIILYSIKLEKEIKPRGVKKGETPQWKVGRKATGRKRDKSLTFKLTEDEKDFLINKLKLSKEKTNTDALLKLLGYKNKD